MNFHRCFQILLLVCVLVLSFASRSVSAASANPTVLRLHWAGLPAVATGTNAAHFIDMWRLPDSQALLAQTLDKLSRWPGNGATNAAAARLRPLLNDLVSNECVLEINAGADSSFSIRHSQFLLAVRLSADRAAFWRTNLAAACADLTSLTTVTTQDGWTLARPAGRIELAVSGSWTLVGCRLDSSVAKSSFAKSLASKVARGPYLEVELAPIGLAAAIAALDLPASSLLHSPIDYPAVHLTVTGQNGDLHTHATLERDNPYSLDLPAWDIPTNLIHGPLTSFGVARGFGSWLAAQPAWQKTGLSPAPDQLAYWSRDGIPFQTYLAAPLPAASNQLARLFPQLVQFGNPWLTTNADGSFAWAANLAGILWNDANILTPFLVSAELYHRDYLFGGLYPPTADAPQPPPARILQAIHDQPGLVFAELEGTGSRVEDGFFILQNFRIVFHKPQMSHEGVGTQWLKKTEHSFDETTTYITLASPHRLELERDATVGLNAFELHLLTDWLESPQFPYGLYTFLAPPGKQ
jgi:hypothetical protein